MFRDQIQAHLFKKDLDFEFQLIFPSKIYWKTHSVFHLSDSFVIIHAFIFFFIFSQLWTFDSLSFELLLSSTPTRICINGVSHAMPLAWRWYMHRVTHAHTHMYALIQTHVHTNWHKTPSWLLAVGGEGKACLSSHACVGVEVEKERGMRYPKLESEWRRCWITWTSSGSSCFLCLSVCLSVTLSVCLMLMSFFIKQLLESLAVAHWEKIKYCSHVSFVFKMCFQM